MLSKQQDFRRLREMRLFIYEYFEYFLGHSVDANGKSVSWQFGDDKWKSNFMWTNNRHIMVTWAQHCFLYFYSIPMRRAWLSAESACHFATFSNINSRLVFSLLVINFRFRISMPHVQYAADCDGCRLLAHERLFWLLTHPMENGHITHMICICRHDRNATTKNNE